MRGHGYICPPSSVDTGWHSASWSSVSQQAPLTASAFASPEAGAALLAAQKQCVVVCNHSPEGVELALHRGLPSSLTAQFRAPRAGGLHPQLEADTHPSSLSSGVWVL